MEDRARHAPDAAAYTFVDERWSEDVLTVGALDRRARRMAAALQSTTPEGARVLLLLPPGRAYLEALLACFYAARIAVPAYPPRAGRGPERLLAIVESATPRLAIASSENVERCRTTLSAAGVAVVASEELDASDASWRRPSIAAGDVALLQYTSGSTATPRGVRVTHGCFVANLAHILRTFRATPSTRGVFWLPPYHDMGLVGGLLSPLAGDFHNTLLSPFMFLRRPRVWLEAIDRYRGTVSGAPNFAYELCLRKIAPAERVGLDLTSWTCAFSGAEPVRAETMEAFAKGFAGCGFRAEAFMACYGLAEATLLVTARFSAWTSDGRLASSLERSREGDGGPLRGTRLVSCGSPPEGVEVLVVDPVARAPVQNSELGEIWVSGPNVADGYFAADDETRIMFGATLAGGDGRRFLRTGDLGFLQDGELYVAGRQKDLVILRGRNVHPSDVEQTAERVHPTVRPGGGAAFGVDDGREERLVLVQEVERVVDQDLVGLARAIAVAIAAEHDVAPLATVLVRSTTLPRTSSGKIQRHACRAAFAAGTLVILHDERAPSMVDEEPVVEASGDPAVALVTWLAQRLSTKPESIDRDAPVLSLGLDSLASVELASFCDRFGLASIDPADIMRGASVNDVLRQLTRTTPAPTRGVVLSAEESPALSHGQLRFWLLDRRFGGIPHANLAAAFWLRGPIDAERLAAALAVVVDRHEVLRSGWSSGASPIVRRCDPPELHVEDIPTPAGIAPRGRAFARVPFDLRREPPLRMALLRTGSEKSLLVIVVHHAAFDGASASIFARELSVAYAGGALGPTPPPYRAFATRERMLMDSGDLESALVRARAAMAARTMARFPPDHPEADTHRSLAGATVGFELPGVLVAKIRSVARARRTTPFVVLLAAFGFLLGRASGKRNVTVAFPVSTRPRDAVNTIGFFVNTTAVTFAVGEAMPFAVLVDAVRRSVVAAYEDRLVPLDVALKGAAHRDVSESTPFPVCFSYQPFRGDAVRAFELPGVAIVEEPLASGNSTFELTLEIEEVAGGLSGAVEYATDLYGPDTIAEVIRRYIEILEHGVDELTRIDVSDVRPGSQLATPTGPVLHSADVLAAFHRRSVDTPEVVAVRHGEHRCTYGRLSERVTTLAAWLDRLDVGPEIVVAIAASPSVERVVVALAVLEAGGALLPIDPTWPKRRVDQVLAGAGASLLLTDRDLDAPKGCRVFRIDAPGFEAAALATATHERHRSYHPDQLAYLVFTSGSTGVPKGVMATRGALAHRVAWGVEVGHAAPGDTALARTSFAFDVSLAELLVPLSAGATLLLVDDDVARDPRLLARVIVDERVSTLDLSPSLLRLVLEQRPLYPGTSSLRRVTCGAEPIPFGLATALRALTSEGVDAMYGPTEATIDACHFSVSAGDEGGIVPLGRALPGVTAFVLDERLAPVREGEAGELYLGGVGLARGYAASPALTAERFMPSPFGPSGARLYKTGDRARWSPAGELEFLGRTDDQVKIRGLRIELGEIERCLEELDGVVQAVAAVHRRDEGDDRLVAYTILARGRSVDDVFAHAQAMLPRTFVPSAIVVVDEVPLTANGKPDRARLPPPTFTDAAEDGSLNAPPSGPLEEVLAEVFGEVLDIDAEKLGASSDFFARGGDSLLAVRAVTRLEELLGERIELEAFFRGRTIAGIRTELERRGDARALNTAAALLMQVSDLTPEQVARLAGDRPGHDDDERGAKG